MDVPTQWNSTYMMLSNAIKFQKTVNSMDSEDGHYMRYFEEIEKVSLSFLNLILSIFIMFVKKKKLI